MRYRFALLWHRLRYRMAPMPIARALVWFVVGHNSETCQRCGRRYLLWFADYDLWNQVIGHYNGLRCLRCFDREAQRLGLCLEWNPKVVS